MIRVYNNDNDNDIVESIRLRGSIFQRSRTYIYLYIYYYNVYWDLVVREDARKMKKEGECKLDTLSGDLLKCPVPLIPISFWIPMTPETWLRYIPKIKCVIRFAPRGKHRAGENFVRKSVATIYSHMYYNIIYRKLHVAVQYTCIL